MKKKHHTLLLGAAVAGLLLCSSCDEISDTLEPKTSNKKPGVFTLMATDIGKDSLQLRALVTDAGSQPLDAIGFVWWNPALFNTDLNKFFDTTSLTMHEVFREMDKGNQFLGIFGANIRENDKGTLFLGTVGSDVMLGTVGGGIAFPGDTLEGLLSLLKIINNRRKGEFSAFVRRYDAGKRYQIRAYARNAAGISYGEAGEFVSP
jgi:hypothetical protein